jgi:hypothetical protein
MSRISGPNNFSVCELLFCVCKVVRAGLDKGPEGGYEAERTKFGGLVVTPEAKGLISLFHGQTECKKNHFGVPAKRTQTVGESRFFSSTDDNGF